MVALSYTRHVCLENYFSDREFQDPEDMMMSYVWAALVWQLMRAYTLSLLNKLKALDQSGTSTDQQIVTWANNKVIDCFITPGLIRNHLTIMQSDASVARDVESSIFCWTRFDYDTWVRKFRTWDSNSNSSHKNLDSDSGPKIYAQNHTPIPTLRTDCVTFWFCT